MAIIHALCSPVHIAQRITQSVLTQLKSHPELVDVSVAHDQMDSAGIPLLQGGEVCDDAQVAGPAVARVSAEDEVAAVAQHYGPALSAQHHRYGKVVFPVLQVAFDIAAIPIKIREMAEISGRGIPGAQRLYTQLKKSI